MLGAYSLLTIDIFVFLFTRDCEGVPSHSEVIFLQITYMW